MTELEQAIELLEAAADLLHVRESLKHPPHAKKMGPIRADAKGVLVRFFRRQKTETLKLIKPKLRTMAQLHEAATDDPRAKELAAAAVPDTLLPISMTQGMVYDFGETLQAALHAGFASLATDDTGAEIASDVVQQYLRDHSLSKLTGDFAQTTVQRLRDALADAYTAGGSYDELVQAVEDTFDDFSSVRAGMIAQTEMNDAYNAGRAALADDIGFNEKSWSCEGPQPCPECLDNEAEGWIPIGAAFPSGDLMPTAHPSCYCSLDYRINNDAVAT
jgi:hypothetical protein